MKRSLLCLACLWLSGCPTPPNDPPPPPRKPEIAVAPPRALGALAAGTDAAPRPEVGEPGGLFEPDAPVVPEPAPAAPEPSAAEPDPPTPHAPAPHAPAAPDAGMAL